MSDNSRRKTRVVAVGNQKGGVAKTTLAVQLAAALGERGKRCLVWDLDMNCGASQHFGIKRAMKLLGTYEVLLGKEDPKDVIVQQGELEEVQLPQNLDLLPARRNLENVDSAFSTELGPMFEKGNALIKPVQTLDGEYDYIFLDTAPNLTTPTIAAYKAAEYFLLSAAPETFAVRGLTEALRDIGDAQRNGNPKLTLIGIVLQAVPGKPTKLSEKLIAFVEKTFDEVPEWMQPYRTRISYSTVISSAQDQGKTIFQTEPKHKVAEQFRALAREFEERLDHLEAEQSARGAPLPRPTTLDEFEPEEALGDGKA